MRLKTHYITGGGLVLLSGTLMINYLFNNQIIPLFVGYVLGGGLIILGTLMMFFKK